MEKTFSTAVNPISPADGATPAFIEKRRDIRIPVLITLEITIRGRRGEVFQNGTIVNISRSGCCIEWPCCKECPGYLEGAIHPLCIFASYGKNKYNGLDLSFRALIPPGNRDVVFKGKAVYTCKFGLRERIGISFTVISPKALRALIKSGSITSLYLKTGGTAGNGTNAKRRNKK